MRSYRKNARRCLKSNLNTPCCRPKRLKKRIKKQQLTADQESKENLTFENDENCDKNAAGTNKTDAKIGKSDANPGQIKEKKIKETLVSR